jgi:hypothetical protein
MANKQPVHRVNEEAAPAYTLAAILGLPVAGYAAYRLMTHHQTGSCSGTRTYLYPQIAIPILLIAAWILVTCLQYSYALSHPKYVYKGLSGGGILIAAVLLCVVSVIALLVNNFCISF